MNKRTIVKLGAVLAALFVLWRVWLNDTVLNAIIMFCTSGIVPGTDTELTPAQVYVVLGAILVVSVVGIFWKYWVRAARWWVRLGSALRHTVFSRSAAAPRTAGADEPAPTALLAGVSKHPKAGAAAAQVAHVPAPVIVIPLPPRPPAYVVAWRRVRPYLLIALGVGLEYGIRWGARTMRYTHRLMLRAYHYSVHAWLRAEPYIRQFDAWLEATLKQSQHFRTGLRHSSQLLDAATNTVKTYAAYWKARRRAAAALKTQDTARSDQE